MSKLKELIAELCPNGVEYKTLGEVATITRGGNFQKKDFKEQGYPCIHYGQIYTKYGLFVEKTITYLTEDCAEKQKKASKNDVIMAVTSENIEDVCKCVAWLGDANVAVSGHTAIIHHTLNAKYLVYYLHTNDFFKQKRKLAHGTKVIEVTPDTLKSVRLPVPPLPVQEEIVRILDSFTSLTVELQTKLQAELQARQKQYEYYRDQRLTFDVHGGGTSEVQWKTLGETCNMKAGRSISSSKISSVCDSNYRYACYGGNGLRGYVELQSHKGEFPIIGRQGALCGNVNYASGEFYATEHAVVVESKGKYLQRFLYHLLISMNLNQYKSQGAQPGLSVKRLEKLIVPIPSMEIQERIVNVLDNFDAICSNLNIGLPAEIEARQKQYEYYRDRLLSFPKLT